LLKETTGAFDGALTHDWPITCHRLHHAAQKKTAYYFIITKSHSIFIPY